MKPGRVTRSWAGGVLLAVVAMIAPGCGAGPSDEAGSEIVVVDALGRTVTLPGVPDRITVAGRAAFMIYDAVYLFPGGAERLVGLEMGRESQKAFVELIDSNLSDGAVLPKDVGPEEIAGTDPDLVMLKSYMAEDLGAPLEQLGLTVLYLDLETPEQYDRDIAVLGAVLGESGRAAEILTFYQERVRRITAVTDELSADARPTVLLIQYSASEGVTTFDVPPASWLQTTMVTMAGGTPVWLGETAGSGWTRVGLEQIAAWDPDQIYVITYTGDSAAVAQDLQAEPAWQDLSAVRAGAVYGFPGDLTSWDQPDSRWILGLTWLFTKVQPELAGQVDIVSEAETLFVTLYRLTPDEFQSGVVPTLFGSLP